MSSDILQSWPVLFKQVDSTVCELHLNKAVVTSIFSHSSSHSRGRPSASVLSGLSHQGPQAAQRWSWLQTPLSRPAGWAGSPSAGSQHSAGSRCPAPPGPAMPELRGQQQRHQECLLNGCLRIAPEVLPQWVAGTCSWTLGKWGAPGARLGGGLRWEGAAPGFWAGGGRATVHLCWGINRNIKPRVSHFFPPGQARTPEDMRCPSATLTSAAY